MSDYDSVYEVVNTNISINPFYTRKDAKSLWGKIIASNIAVHKDQLNKNAFYFDFKNEHDLVKK